MAAEYVLGLLNGDARREVENRAASDPVLAAAIAAWQRDLEPAARLDAPSPPPPSLWRRIEATLDRETTTAKPTGQAPTQGLLRRLALWRAAALTAAAAAAVAGFLLWQAEAARPVAVGVMLTQDQAGPPLPMIVTAAGRINVRPQQPLPVAPGRRLDVWAKPLHASAPRLLGEVPAAGGSLSFAGLSVDVTTVMITSDPGRSQSGLNAPGETLYLGVLTATPR